MDEQEASAEITAETPRPEPAPPAPTPPPEPKPGENVPPGPPSEENVPGSNTENGTRADDGQEVQRFAAHQPYEGSFPERADRVEFGG